MAEDDDAFREVLALALGAAFPETTIECVADGRAALDAIQRNPPAEDERIRLPVRQQAGEPEGVQPEPGARADDQRQQDLTAHVGDERMLDP